jgi:hypothetical protein
MSKMISPDKIQLELNKLAKAAKTLSVNDLRMILALERVIARVENHKKLSKHLFSKADLFCLRPSIQIASLVMWTLLPSAFRVNKSLTLWKKL